MEHEERESAGGTTGATRSQHVVYTLPHDWGTIPQFLAPALERLDRDAADTQLLVVTPDAETALAVADAALAPRASRGTGDSADRPPVLPVTSVTRAERILRARPVPAVAGTADALAALVRSAALKLHGVRALVLAWPDEGGPTANEALEAVLAEVPKDAARVMVAAEETPEMDALAERYLWRARRVPAAATGEGEAVAIRYVAVAPTARASALRRLLDELDPASAAVVALSDASTAEARRALRGLGYPSVDERAEGEADAASAAAAAFGPDVPVTRGDVPPNTELVVLYDMPTDRAALDRIAAAKPRQVIALVQPRQLSALARVAGAAPRPFALGDVARQARSRDEALRGELRAALAEGAAGREMLALEPLLEDHDGLEIAAAALRLLERARAAAAASGAGARTGVAERAPESSGMTRIFLTVGSRDGARPGDLVGAIAGEAGITSDRIGKIDVRDSHSLVEIASADAARVVERVNGITIRGRRVVARPERDAGGRSDRPDRGDRGERRGFGERRATTDRRGGFGDRPERGDRPPRGDRPERGPRPDRGDRPERRPSRGFDTTREGPRGFGAPDDRAVSERAEQRGEWAERAERLRRARRGGEEGSDAGEMGADDRGADRAPRPRDDEA